MLDTTRSSSSREEEETKGLMISSNSSSCRSELRVSANDELGKELCEQ